VNGLVDIPHLKQNNTARAGDLLLLTKSLGTGVLSTAQKRNALSPEYFNAFVKQLTQLNKVGADLGKIEGVHAMTDTTGFGLLGHLIEMTGGSGVSALLHYKALPVLPGVLEGIAQKYIPGGTNRNWKSYGEHVGFAPGIQEQEVVPLLADPQTNGGLLISVDPASLPEVRQILEDAGLGAYTQPIGEMTAPSGKLVTVD
jgi:selenide,water dikinase